MSVSKIVAAAASSAGSDSLDIDDVFSTFLYAGNDSTQTITNNIDLSNEGGLVWIKSRSDTQSHELVDTVRGNTKFIRTHSTTANRTSTSGDVTAFTSSGFSLGASSTAGVNNSGNEYVSWTWRKAPKYFDIVTYTGDNTAGRTISHSLESVPGMIWVKRTDSTEDWSVWHRNLETNSSGETTQLLKLNSSDGAFPPLASIDSSSSPVEDVRSATSTTFTVGNDNRVNANSATYVAYIFAHHNNDGEFGPSANQDIINCGTYTGAGSTDVDVTLGFEPQWIIIKKTSSNGNQWVILDNIRGTVTGGDDNFFYASLASSENTNDYLEFNSTGFRITGTSDDVASSGETYIYMAIRRGPLTKPTSASSVFEIDNAGSTGDGAAPKFRSTFPVDFALRKDTGSGNWEALTRLLQGTSLRPNDTNPEDTGSGGDQFDYMNGYNTGTTTDSSLYSWMWKRAPEYFDVVTYDGNGTAGRTINHNLGVVPEMMWIKNRGYDAGGGNGEGWFVYHKGLNGGTDPEDYGIRLDTNAAQVNDDLNGTAPTSTVFTVGNDRRVNALLEASINNTYIAYLFATVAGVSKVGSYTGNGTTDGSKVIDCGFSSGAKFVLIKRTDSTGNWAVFDSDRGIVAGNDSNLRINLSTAAETSIDYIDPDNSGFIVGVGTDSRTVTNINTGNYIFYAIAA